MYDGPDTPTEHATGIRAHISSPNGQERFIGGEQSIVTFRLDCDPVDLKHTDLVRDDVTGLVFQVVWAMPRYGLDLDHVEADLRMVEGEA